MDKAERTKQHILKVSADLFNTKGYAGTAISDILNASGYSKGAMYNVFKDKDTLSEEAFQYNFEQLRLIIRGALQSASGSKKKLKAVVRASKITAEQIKGGCPMLNTAVEVDDTNERMNEMVKKNFRVWQKAIEEVITAGIAKKEIRADVNSEQVALFLIASIEGSILLSQSKKDKGILEICARQLDTYIDTLS